MFFLACGEPNESFDSVSGSSSSSDDDAAAICFSSAGAAAPTVRRLEDVDRESWYREPASASVASTSAPATSTRGALEALFFAAGGAGDASRSSARRKGDASSSIRGIASDLRMTTFR